MGKSSFPSLFPIRRIRRAPPKIHQYRYVHRNLTPVESVLLGKSQNGFCGFTMAVMHV